MRATLDGCGEKRYAAGGRRFLAFFIVLLILPSRFAPSPRAANATGYTNKDKLEIVKLTLEEILAPTVNFLNRRQRERGITLSSRNLKKEWSKSLRGYQVKVLHPLDIERTAWREGSFQYLEFTLLKVVGDKVVVELDKAWAQGPSDFKERTERSSIVLEFRKDGGIFRREVVSRRYQSVNRRRNFRRAVNGRENQEAKYAERCPSEMFIRINTFHPIADRTGSGSNVFARPGGAGLH